MKDERNPVVSALIGLVGVLLGRPRQDPQKIDERKRLRKQRKFDFKRQRILERTRRRVLRRKLKNHGKRNSGEIQETELPAEDESVGETSQRPDSGTVPEQFHLIADPQRGTRYAGFRTDACNCARTPESEPKQGENSPSVVVSPIVLFPSFYSTQIKNMTPVPVVSGVADNALFSLAGQITTDIVNADANQDGVVSRQERTQSFISAGQKAVLGVIGMDYQKLAADVKQREPGEIRSYAQSYAEAADFPNDEFEEKFEKILFWLADGLEIFLPAPQMN